MLANGSATTTTTTAATSAGDENALEAILVSEVYPKKPMQCDEDGLRAPFPPLHGESVEFLGRTSDGVIALSNYRIFVLLKESFINIPIGIVESVEYRDIFYMHVFCKDARTFRCAFPTNDACLEWCKRLMRAIRSPSRLQEVFAFSFHAWLSDAKRQAQAASTDIFQSQLKQDDVVGSVFDREVQRLGFDLKSAWRITYVNNDFKICPSYPKLHIVPHSVSDKDIESVAGFRSSRRFPSIVWRDVRSGAVLARSSQPEVGWLGWRNTQDESLLLAIASSCSLNAVTGNDVSQFDVSNIAYNDGVMNGSAAVPTASLMTTVANGSVVNGVKNGSNGFCSAAQNLLIIDARSYAAAVANRAKGGGCECQDYYANCEILFMSLANIHTIRKSFLALRAMCAMSPEQPGWLINLENTKWLLYISGLLKASLVVVNAIDKEHKPVLVHCSDGWDRTPQIVALAEIMLDPYYRTIEGFRVLVEKEWLEFGHKFADRCGQGVTSDDVNERCPVFLQWLDCIHQLVRQFPCNFQFNETYLVKLVQHVYSCLFGDFLCNTERDRASQRVRQLTSSIWSLLSKHNLKFVNLLYRPGTERVLRPSCHVQNLHFWDAVYLSETAPAMVSSCTTTGLGTTDELIDTTGSEASSSSAVTSPDQQVSLPVKTRSCDDLTKASLGDEDDDVHPMMTAAQRRLSDPNIAAHVAAAISEGHEALVQNLVAPTLLHADISGDNNSLNSVFTSDICNERELKHGPVLSLVALSARKCASNETLKAVEDDVYEASCLTHATLASTDITELDSLADKSPVNCCLTEPVDSTVQTAVNPAVLALFEASSDTLTDEDYRPTVVVADSHSPAADVDDEDEVSNATEPSVSETTIIGPLVDGFPADSVGEMSVSVTSRTSKSMLNKCSSTSDISSSHIADDFFLSSVEPTRRLMAPLTVDTRLAFAGAVAAGAGGGRVAAGDNDGSCSRTPSCSSTNPPTPNGDAKMPTWSMRPGGKVSRHCLDWDGLTYHVDPVQQRLAQILSEHNQQISQLERQLAATKQLLNKYAANNGGGQCQLDSKDELASNDSGERASTSGASAVASDLSWEQVEEKDSRVTLWVPDHVMTHCAGCHQEFWMVRRKHHCRSCGHVFCADCSDYFLPVPQQHLDKPVRICFQCHRQAMSSATNNGYDATTQTNATDNNSCKRIFGLNLPI